jgi:hypothetical protein
MCCTASALRRPPQAFGNFEGSLPSSSIHAFSTAVVDFTKGVQRSLIDVPGGSGTTASGVNPQGDIVGNYNDSSGNGHGFLLRAGTFSNIDVPGLTLIVNGINAQGDIVGYYNGSDGHVHGFVLHAETFSTIDPPGSSFTQAWGINPQGDIVGLYTDTSGVTHGFLLSKH